MRRGSVVRIIADAHEDDANTDLSSSDGR
jgi:hypothetical protein